MNALTQNRFIPHLPLLSILYLPQKPLPCKHKNSLLHLQSTTMKLWQILVRRPLRTSPPVSLYGQNSILSSNGKRVSLLGCQGFRFFPNCACSCSNSGSAVSSSPAGNSSSSPRVASNSCYDSAVSQNSSGKLEFLEESIEKVIYRCRFLAILGVFGSLVGSFLCFIKGCTIVAESFSIYLVERSKVIQMLIEAVDVYLLGTVMLVFGMGLYELFVSNLGSAGSLPGQKPSDRSNLFGLFALKVRVGTCSLLANLSISRILCYIFPKYRKFLFYNIDGPDIEASSGLPNERPRWLEITTVNELKTKVGHVIVMLLLIGLFDKSKRAAIHTPVDLLCFCASVFLSSSCLFLLSKLNEAK